MLSLFAISCSNTTKIKTEKSNGSNLTEVVPDWYLEYPDKKKDKNYIYGAGTSTSPDLQLAKEKSFQSLTVYIARSLRHCWTA